MKNKLKIEKRYKVYGTTINESFYISDLENPYGYLNVSDEQMKELKRRLLVDDYDL